MELDDNFLYGTTRNSKLEMSGENVFIWRVSVIDGLPNLGSNNFIAR